MVGLWVRKGHTVKFWTITNGSDQHDMDQKWAVYGQDETKLPAGKTDGQTRSNIHEGTQFVTVQDFATEQLWFC